MHPRGYGFIASDNGEDHFVHKSDLQRSQINTDLLEDGKTRFSYELEKDERNNKTKAVRLTIIDWGGAAMFGFSKRASPLSSADFEKQLSALISLGRLSNVNRADMAKSLERHAGGLRREINRVIEDRNMRATPVMWDGNGKRIPC
jgi:cold shock CspA family protein